MKLIYMWVENYRDFIKEQGFSFSSEYDVHYKNILSIKKNKNFIENFYGENILDITAVVGENGAGKTTLAKFVYNNCESVHALSEGFNESYYDSFKQIQVYTDKYMLNGVEKEKIIIYYFLGKKTSLKVDCSGIDYDTPVCLYGLKNDDENSFDKACDKHKMTTLYFSNAFDISHAAPNIGFGEVEQSQVNKALCFSPMFDLKKSVVTSKKMYGSTHKKLNRLLEIIKNYSEKMCEDYYTSYRNYLSRNILLAFENAPKSIKDTLSIFRQFNISTIEFGEYIKFEYKINSLDVFDKSVYFIRENIYKKIAKVMGAKTVFEHIYINILCEIVLYLNIFNSNQIIEKFDEVLETYIDIYDDQSYEAIINQIVKDNPDKLKDIQLVERIRNTDSVDISVIEEFFNFLDHKLYPNLKETDWYNQVEEYVLNFNKISNLVIDKNINFKNSDVIEFLLEEFKKENSIYRRMINIEPPTSSTGEISLVNLFASLYQAIELKRMSNSVLLVIDEIDAYLHPRWQQEIINWIISWINESRYFKDTKIQLIITSHSPIVLSDITSDRVIKLKKDQNGRCIVQNCEIPTFGSNIATLFYDSFFMEKGSIGEVVKSKIEKVIEYNNGNNQLNEREIEYIIDSIGEPIVQRKLRADFLKVKRKKNEHDELNKMLMEVGYQNAIEILKKSMRKDESDDKN